MTRNLGTLIGANYVSCNEVDHRRGHNVVVVDRPEAVVFRGYWDGVFDAHLSEHPIVDHFVRTGELAAVKISDFLGRRQFHALGLYQEFFRCIRTEHQLAAGVAVGPGELIDIGLDRTRPDFSERDRPVLNVLRSHLADAYRNVRHIGAIEQDLAVVLRETDGMEGAVVLLGADGRIRRASVRAMRLLRSYFGAAGTTGGPLPDAYQKLGVENHTTAAADTREPGDPPI